MEILREGISTEEFIRIINENFADISSIRGVDYSSFITLTDQMSGEDIIAYINSNLGTQTVFIGSNGLTFKSAIHNKLIDLIDNESITQGEIKLRLNVAKTTVNFKTLSRGVNSFLGYSYLYGQAPYVLSFKIGNIIKTYTFTSAGLILNGYGFDNGSAIICMRDNTIYKTNDQLETLSTISLKDINDEDYVFESGNSYYFNNPYCAVAHGYIGENEVAVFGNYTQPSGAVNPINVYYSVNGVGLKVALKLESTVTHVHSQKFNPNDSSFWIFTGDAGTKNCWYKGIYNATSDSWIWEQIISEANQLEYERFRLIGIEFIGEYVIWGSDGIETGIYKCKLSEINDISKHSLVKSSDTAIYSSNKNGNHIFMTYMNGNLLSYSKDAGETWNDIELGLAETDDNLRNILDVNEDGYNLIQNPSQTKSILVKIL